MQFEVLNSSPKNDRLEYFWSRDWKIFYIRRKGGSVFPDERFDKKWSNELEHGPHHVLADTRGRPRPEAEHFIAIVPNIS